MLRMSPFFVEHPASVEEALALLAKHGDKAKLCAGGTDLVPNLKHGLYEPEVVVHLSRVSELGGIEETYDALVLGAMTSIHEIATSDLVRQHAPGLADAASQVAGPRLRRMGTLGGNLCLDTRCLYYNQTYFWREALGFCLKKDGTQCHVVASGKNCVAAASNDTATMLLCLDAVVEIQSRKGRRKVKLPDFYVADGMKNTVLEPDELLVRVRVPKRGQSARRLEGFAKLRHRHAIDSPLLSIGVRFDVGDDDEVLDARLCVNAIAARPKLVPIAFAQGRRLDDALIDEIAKTAHKKVKPLTNIADDPTWRKEMVPVFVRRAIRAALERPALA